MRMKRWYIASIVLTILFFGLGITYPGESSKIISIWLVLIGTISLAGIILFTLKYYKAAKTLFITSGIMGFPIGILLIIFGYMIDY